MERWLTCLLAVAAALATAGCSPNEPTLRWRLSFADASLQMRAAWIQVRVLRGGCDASDPVYEAIVDRASSTPSQRRLERGRYGLEALAHDGVCVRFARGCEEVDVPGGSDREVVVELAQLDPEVAACPALECMAGRCVSPDGGGSELCNGSDDDGDTRIDEGYDLTSDVAHCGACGHACEAGADCVDGLCPLDVAEVSTGGSHACARRRSGEVLCWGSNAEQALGDGTMVDRPAPTVVIGVEANDVCAGGGHTCALTSDGGVVCWGGNTVGQLGDGSTTRRGRPVSVLGLAGPVRAIDCGGYHTCALLESGSIACWGWNERGQLGRGTTSSSSVAGLVVGIDDAVQISANEPACAVRRSGEVVCWGDNATGGVGDGTIGEPRLTPGKNVVGVVGAIEVGSAGGFGCARLESGGVSCWGANDLGQLGDGTAGAPRPTAAPVLFVDDAVHVEVGHDSGCVVRRTGEVACWGWNDSGQLGDGTTAARQVPGPALGIAGARSLASVVYLTFCAIGADTTVLCWGWNDHGQVGDGTVTPRTSPVVVPMP